MKLIKKSILLFALLGFFTACNNAPKGEEAETKAPAKVEEVAADKFYKVNVENSVVNWTGSKIGGQHTGTLNIAEGKLKTKDGVVNGGTFNIDMNSLTCTDLEGKPKGDLEGHLKGKDFFEVETYPKSNFQISKVTKLDGEAGVTHMVYGNLKLKDVTKEVAFKANISITEKGISVSTPNFTIDRTDFNVKYGSNKFFDGLKDKAINDKVGLSIKLEAS